MKRSRHFGAACALASLLAATAPAAQEADADLITDPVWRRFPTGADVGRLYPRRAQHQGAGGRAVAECRVTAAGALQACTLISEEPQGLGFGEAALKMAAKFRMKAKAEDGRPVEGRRVRVPMTWNIP